jgi:cytochrome c
MPDYYHGKFFIYDWIRGWIKAVTLQPNGDFDKMEPFMPSTKLNALIDMEVGPDGKIYMLEYGSGWFSKNPDAALSRIDYNPGELKAKIDTANVAGQPKPAVDSAQFKQGHQEGHQQPDSLLAGKNLMDNSDCRTCHKLDEASIGPAYTAVAAKYKKDQKSVDHLVNKIINGGGGVWGETVMPAHPGIKPAEAKQIVDYILSLKKG